MKRAAGLLVLLCVSTIATAQEFPIVGIWELVATIDSHVFDVEVAADSGYRTQFVLHADGRFEVRHSDRRLQWEYRKGSWEPLVEWGKMVRIAWPEEGRGDEGDDLWWIEHVPLGTDIALWKLFVGIGGVDFPRDVSMLLVRR